MKIFAIHVTRFVDNSKVLFLCSKSDVQSFGFLERKPVRELSDFLARQILPKTAVGQRNIVSHQGYLFVSLRWSDGLALSAFTDKDYPTRLAFQALTRIHDDFKAKVPERQWKGAQKDHEIDFKHDLKAWLKQYQDPQQFDAVTKAQQKADDVKEILQRDIEQVLGNHAQIEQLLEKSEDISAQSEMMFKAAKKTRQGCCALQ